MTNFLSQRFQNSSLSNHEVRVNCPKCDQPNMVRFEQENAKCLNEACRLLLPPKLRPFNTDHSAITIGRTIGQKASRLSAIIYWTGIVGLATFAGGLVYSVLPIGSVDQNYGAIITLVTGIGILIGLLGSWASVREINGLGMMVIGSVVGALLVFGFEWLAFLTFQESILRFVEGLRGDYGVKITKLALAGVLFGTWLPGTWLGNRLRGRREL